MGRSSSSSDEEEHKSKRRKHEKSSSSKHDKKRHKKEKKREHSRKESERSADVCFEPISESDYFLKTAEFQHWLQEKRSTFLDEITSDEARRLFKKFSSKWNAGELDATYYTGVKAGAVQSAASRTRHQWGFVSKLNDADQLRRPT